MTFKLPQGIFFADSQSEEALSSALSSTTSVTPIDIANPKSGSIKIENGPQLDLVSVPLIAALVGNVLLLQQFFLVAAGVDGDKSFIEHTPSAAAARSHQHSGDKRSIAEFAARGNQVAVLELIVAQFGIAAADVPNEAGGFTPIAIATQYGHLATVQFLHEKCGAKVDRVFVGKRTLLHLAVRMNRVAVAEYLLLSPLRDRGLIDRDAKMEVISGASKTVLEVATKNSVSKQNNNNNNADAQQGGGGGGGVEAADSPPVADIVKREHDDAELAGEANAFALACAEGSVEMISLLLREKCHVQNLLEATGSSKQLIERVPISCGSSGDPKQDKVNTQQQDHLPQLKQEKLVFKKFAGFPVMPGEHTKKLEETSTTEATASYVVHLERKRDIVQSPVHTACAQGNVAAVKFLLERTQFDCDKNARVSGATPLYLAVRFNRVEVVRYLLSSEVRVEVDKGSGEGAGSSSTQDSTNFCLPLFAACFYNHCEIAKLLLEHNATSSLSYKGATPFIAAIANGSVDCVKLLIEMKADTTSTYKGDSPLTFAKNEGKTAIVEILTENKIV